MVLLEILKRFWLIWTLDGFLNHGFDGWRSPEQATIIGYYGVSLDGCPWCVEASSELVGLSATCRTSMPGSAETHGLFTGTSRSVLQCPGSCLCWWPLFVDVLPQLTRSWLHNWYVSSVASRLSKHLKSWQQMSWKYKLMVDVCNSCNMNLTIVLRHRCKKKLAVLLAELFSTCILT